MQPMHPESQTSNQRFEPMAASVSLAVPFSLRSSAAAQARRWRPLSMTSTVSIGSKPGAAKRSKPPFGVLGHRVAGKGSISAVRTVWRQ